MAKLTDCQVSEVTGQTELLEMLTATAKIYRTEPFYTEATVDVKNVRLWLARYSIERSKKRLMSQATIKKYMAPKHKRLQCKAVYSRIENMMSNASQVADDRPVACCAFTNDGSHLLTASWMGTVKVWSIPQCAKVSTFKAHDERITGLATNPNSGLVKMNGPAFATASADLTARVWASDGTLLCTLTSHEDRLGRVAFHPSGRLLATACFDQTWRLWDLERSSTILEAGRRFNWDRKLLYEQEGHGGPIYSVAFQCDGSLLASGGLDAIGRLWDLRTGRSIVTLTGHAKSILALDFSPDGYHIVTGSLDNSCQVWDLRKAACQHTIGAHKNLVSHVRYCPGSGDYFVSAGYDHKARVWSAHETCLVQVLYGHDDKVMGVDIHPDPYSDLIATISYDRTFKLWWPNKVVKG
jgi:U4/U6 small nuclear ribonucleoprotein PRP4